MSRVLLDLAYAYHTQHTQGAAHRPTACLPPRPRYPGKAPPVPMTDDNYHAELFPGQWRKDIKPLDVVQPEVRLWGQATMCGHPCGVGLLRLHLAWPPWHPHRVEGGWQLKCQQSL